MKKQEVAHTPFVEAGVYEKSIGDEVVRGMLIASSKKKNGVRSGTIYCSGHVPEVVIEGTESLDVWKLAIGPDQILEPLLSRIEKLEKQVEKLTDRAEKAALRQK